VIGALRGLAFAREFSRLAVDGQVQGEAGHREFIRRWNTQVAEEKENRKKAEEENRRLEREFSEEVKARQREREERLRKEFGEVDPLKGRESFQINLGEVENKEENSQSEVKSEVKSSATTFLPAKVSTENEESVYESPLNNLARKFEQGFQQQLEENSPEERTCFEEEEANTGEVPAEGTTNFQPYSSNTLKRNSKTNTLKRGGTYSSVFSPPSRVNNVNNTNNTMSSTTNNPTLLEEGARKSVSPTTTKQAAGDAGTPTQQDTVGRLPAETGRISAQSNYSSDADGGLASTNIPLRNRPSQNQASLHGSSVIHQTSMRPVLGKNVR
jgi:hypothetical protein